MREIFITFAAGTAGLRSIGLPRSSISLPCSSSLKGAGPPTFGPAAALPGAAAAPMEEESTYIKVKHLNATRCLQGLSRSGINNPQDLLGGWGVS